MRRTITTLRPSMPLTDDSGVGTFPFQNFLSEVARNALMIDSGSPEGVVAAQQGAFYMDANGTTGAVLYVKRLDDIGGDTSKGWTAV